MRRIFKEYVFVFLASLTGAVFVFGFVLWFYSNAFEVEGVVGGDRDKGRVEFNSLDIDLFNMSKEFDEDDFSSRVEMIGSAEMVERGNEGGNGARSVFEVKAVGKGDDGIVWWMASGGGDFYRSFGKNTGAFKGKVRIIRRDEAAGFWDLFEAGSDELALLPGIDENDARQLKSFLDEVKAGRKRFSRVDDLRRTGLTKGQIDVIRPLLAGEEGGETLSLDRVVFLEASFGVREDKRSIFHKASKRFSGEGEMTALLIRDFSSPLGRPLKIYDGNHRLVAVYSGRLGDFRTVFVRGDVIEIVYDPRVSSFYVDEVLQYIGEKNGGS